MTITRRRCLTRCNTRSSCLTRISEPRPGRASTVSRRSRNDRSPWSVKTPSKLTTSSSPRAPLPGQVPPTVPPSPRRLGAPTITLAPARHDRRRYRLSRTGELANASLLASRSAGLGPIPAPRLHQDALRNETAEQLGLTSAFASPPAPSLPTCLLSATSGHLHGRNQEGEVIEADF